MGQFNQDQDPVQARPRTGDGAPEEVQNQGIQVARLLMEVAKLFRDNLNKMFEAKQITRPQGMVIAILSRFEKMKVSQIGELLSLSNGTVSVILDRLEQRGLIQRTRSAEDKRVVYVSLTPKFKERHQDFHGQMNQHIARMVAQGTPEELERVMDGLNILKRLLSGAKTD